MLEIFTADKRKTRNNMGSFGKDENNACLHELPTSVTQSRTRRQSFSDMHHTHAEIR